MAHQEGDTLQLYTATAGQVDGPYEGVCRDAKQNVWFLPEAHMGGTLGSILFTTKAEAISEAQLQCARLQRLLDRKKAALDLLEK